MSRKQGSSSNPLWIGIITGVCTTLVLTVLGGLWNYGTNGGLVRLMGGLTDKDAIAAGAIPSGAVLIIDSHEGCPKGWGSIGEKEAGVFAGRAIVAVGGSKPSYRQTGGGSVVLSLSQIPMHTHQASTKEKIISFPGTGIRPELVMGRPEAIRVLVPDETAGGDGKEKMVAVNTVTQPKPVEIIAPFVALYFCKKG